MCKKSTTILQGILTDLVSDSDEITSEKFPNSELRVTLLPVKLSQGSSVENNGSLLKSLLSSNSTLKNKTEINTSNDLQRGGLKNIIAFTRSFDFGYGGNNESSLSKLVQFSESFFKRDFSAFQSTVLYIIEDENYLDDEDEMFNIVPDEITELKFEEVIVEPDIRIKTEIIDGVESPCDEIYDNVIIKTESPETFDQDCLENVQYHTEVPFIENLNYLNKLYHRTYSHNNVRCRTRENPYINPYLKKQFMFRSFQCIKCPRYFKTPGYLKAHCAKVHNALY